MVWSWRWSSPKTPQPVPSQGRSFTSVAEPMPALNLPSLLPSKATWLLFSVSSTAQFNSMFRRPSVFWAEHIRIPVLITLYPGSLFLINCLTWSSHSSLHSCPSSSLIPYTPTTSRLSHHPLPIATPCAHTPLKSTPIPFFPFDPLHRCFCLTGRPITSMVRELSSSCTASTSLWRLVLNGLCYKMNLPVQETNT